MVKNSPANAGDMGLTGGQEKPPEKEMATHSSILAWEIPEEPSRGDPKRAGHDLATKQKQSEGIKFQLSQVNKC